jgi:hypothetical protein
MKTPVACWSLFAVSLCALSARADAQEGWSITFSPQSLTAISTPLSAVVVIAGGGQPDGAAAANALIAGLRASGRASLVMDASSIGDVSTLDDAAMVARAQSLPVDQIVIVRTFPDGPGQVAAVVSIYDKRGASLGASRGSRGSPLVAAAQAPPPGYAQPGYPPYAPYAPPSITTSAPPPNAPSPELSPRPDSVPVAFASVGRPLQLNALDTTTVSGVRGYYHPYPYAYSTITPRPLCETPCTLYLPPGAAQLRVNGDGISPRTVSFGVPSTGADLRLRAPSAAMAAGGAALTVVGAVGLIIGASVLGYGEIGKTTTTVEEFGESATHTKNHGLIVGGGVTMGVSALMLATGITLLATNRGGVATSTPHQGPTARLSIGAGNALVSGTF